MRYITEKQYRDLFLNETMHYPDEMNHIFAIVFNKAVAPNFVLMKRLQLDAKKYVFEYECEYFKNITFLFSFYEDGDINVATDYHGSYKNERELVDTKIQNPLITIEAPRTEDWKINLTYIESATVHELTHLYDDWQNMIHGNPSLFKSKPNQEMLKFKEASVDNDSFIVKAIAEIAYFISKSETKAFYAQTYHELKALGCNNKNYHEKIKETASYKAIVKNRDLILKSVDFADKTELENINQHIRLSFPHMKMTSIGTTDFDKQRYVEKLKTFVERECRRFLNNYGSVVQLYIDDYNRKLVAN